MGIMRQGKICHSFSSKCYPSLLQFYTRYIYSKTNHAFVLFGKFRICKFLEFKKILDSSEFIFNDLQAIFFFPSMRWDLKTKNNTLIKLPEKKILQTLKIAYKIINDENLKDNQIIDLRIPKQVIIQK